MTFAIDAHTKILAKGASTKTKERRTQARAPSSSPTSFTSGDQVLVRCMRKRARRSWRVKSRSSSDSTGLGATGQVTEPGSSRFNGSKVQVQVPEPFEHR